MAKLAIQFNELPQDGQHVILLLIRNNGFDYKEKGLGCIMDSITTPAVFSNGQFKLLQNNSLDANPLECGYKIQSWM
jgi:hypothetical protein